MRNLLLDNILTTYRADSDGFKRIRAYFCKIKKTLVSLDFSSFTRVFLVAERERFELSVRDYRTHDFQSCALDQLSHLSVPTCILYHIFCFLSSAFSQFFSFFQKTFLPFHQTRLFRHALSISSLLCPLLSFPVERKSVLSSTFFQNDIYKKEISCYNIK